VVQDPCAAEAFYRISIYALENIGHPAAAVTLQRLPARLPLLVLWGEDDKFVESSNAAGIEQACAAKQQPCEVELIPNASHCAHDDNPALVTQQLADFLTRLACEPVG